MASLLIAVVLLGAMHWLSVGLLARLQGVNAYTQSQPKLVGSGASGSAAQGQGTAVSGDGLTACVGGYGDSSIGAVWFYTRANAATFTWSQQGSKVAPKDSSGLSIYFGSSCSLSFNGNIAVVGGYGDKANIGATWIITRDVSGAWTQQGAKLVGTGYICGTNCVWQGFSNSLASAAANVYITAGWGDNSNAGIGV